MRPPSSEADWLSVVPDGVTASVHAQPGASREGVEGVARRDDGRSYLRLRVRAQPEDGKANAALIVLLAKLAGVPKSAVALEAGAGSRLKRFRILCKNGPTVAATLRAAADRAAR